MKALRIGLSFLFLSIVFLEVPNVQADTLTLEFSNVFPTKPSPGGSPPWLTATFEDVSGGVKLTLDANLTGTNFFSNIYFNYNDPTKLPFTWTPSTGVSQGPDAFKADGDGYYDILISLPTGNNDNRFDGTEQLVFNIAGTDIAALNFEDVSNNTTYPYFGAAHVQGIPVTGGGTTSSWIYATVKEEPPIPPLEQVPEPGTFALVGLGLTLFSLYRRARRS